MKRREFMAAFRDLKREAGGHDGDIAFCPWCNRKRKIGYYMEDIGVHVNVTCRGCGQVFTYIVESIVQVLVEPEKAT